MLLLLSRRRRPPAGALQPRAAVAHCATADTAEPLRGWPTIGHRLNSDSVGHRRNSDGRRLHAASARRLHAIFGLRQPREEHRRHRRPHAAGRRRAPLRRRPLVAGGARALGAAPRRLRRDERVGLRAARRGVRADGGDDVRRRVARVAGLRYAVVPAVASLFLTFTASVACLSVIADGATDLCSALTGIDYFALPRDAILVALVGAVHADLLAALARAARHAVEDWRRRHRRRRRRPPRRRRRRRLRARWRARRRDALPAAAPRRRRRRLAGADAAATSVAARLPSAGGVAFFSPCSRMRTSRITMRRASTPRSAVATAVERPAATEPPSSSIASTPWSARRLRRRARCFWRSPPPASRRSASRRSR